MHTQGTLKKRAENDLTTMLRGEKVFREDG